MPLVSPGCFLVALWTLGILDTSETLARKNPSDVRRVLVLLRFPLMALAFPQTLIIINVWVNLSVGVEKDYVAVANPPRV